MENEKQQISIMLILAIFVHFISPLIFFFMQKNISEFGRKMIVDTLNFELTLLIIGLVISIIPVVGFLMIIVGPVLFILNIIACLNANNAFSQGLPYKYPFSFELIK